MIKKHTKSGYFCSECNTFSNGDYWERGVDKLCRKCKEKIKGKKEK